MVFTPDQIDEILKRAANGESNAAIAKRFGSHHKTIERIRKEHGNAIPEQELRHEPEAETEAETEEGRPEVADGAPWRRIADGPTTAYRDGPDGVVHVLDCPDGCIPPDWHDSPAACANCDGKSHPSYVKVDP